jgi:MFS family permease
MMASPTSQEYVGRIAPRDKVALYMGYYFVAVALGNLFGGILSGQFYGWLARDLQRPDLMWLCFGGIMLGTAVVFLLYNKFAVPAQVGETIGMHPEPEAQPLEPSTAAPPGVDAARPADDERK